MTGALPIMLVLVLACGGSGDEAGPTTLPIVATTEIAAVISSTTPTTMIPSTTTTPSDPATLMAAAMTAGGPNYRFNSVVLVGEQTLTTVSGVVDGNSVSAEIITGTREVSYVRTADGEWATGADGKWVELEGEPPVGAPLGALADAGNLVLESGDAEQSVLTGVLGPAAGDAQGLAFTLTLENGLVTEIRYQVDTGGELAQVITTLSDFGSAGTVTKPEDV